MEKVRTRLERHTVRSRAGAKRHAASDIATVIARPKITVHPLMIGNYVMLLSMGGGSGKALTNLSGTQTGLNAYIQTMGE